MKFNKLLYCIFIFIVLIVQSCQTSTPQSSAGKVAFFSLRGYFKTEIERLKHDIKKVKKIVTINGKSEEKFLDNIDFEEELTPFMASDINRPAWSDYYMPKITPLGQGTVSEYYALKDHLKTRSIVVKDQMSGTDMDIVILNAETTLATNAETHLSYNNHTGYTISTVQKLFGYIDSVKVDVKFL